MDKNEILIKADNLSKHYQVRSNIFRKGKHKSGSVLKAVDNISLVINKGKSLGLAGESGCGKTTTGKLLLKLEEPTLGEYTFDGKNVSDMKSRAELLDFRRKSQLMFQNPYEALNPRFTVLRALMEPLIIHNIGETVKERKQLIHDSLENVNLHPAEEFMEKYPHQMSGGQLQRVVLARALIIDPIFLVADEPVSMLDVSVRASVLNLMKDVSKKMGLTTVYISHDLSLIEYMCDEVDIMYLGTIVEKGVTKSVLNNPVHPYTKALMAASLSVDPTAKKDEIKINNSISDPVNLPDGCIFQDRCPYVMEKCRDKAPQYVKVADDHYVACYLADQDNS